MSELNLAVLGKLRFRNHKKKNCKILALITTTTAEKHLAHTRVASASRPSWPAFAMKLLGRQERRRLLDGRGSGTRSVHGATFPAVGTRLGGARIQHHVAIGTAESLGTRARVSIRSRALARSTVQARFMRPAVVQI